MFLDNNIHLLFLNNFINKLRIMIDLIIIRPFKNKYIQNIYRRDS